MKCKYCRKDMPVTKYQHKTKLYCSTRCQRAGFKKFGYAEENISLKCQSCGEEIPVLTFGDKHRKYCDDCLDERIKQQKRDSSRKAWSPAGRRSITVTYPDVVLPDFWTRREYDTYKRDLPVGCIVEGI